MPYLIENAIKKSIVTNNSITPLNLDISNSRLIGDINANFNNLFNNLSDDSFESIDWTSQYKSNDINNLSINNLSVQKGYGSSSYVYDDTLLILDKTNNTLIINYTDDKRIDNNFHYAYIVLDSTAFLWSIETLNMTVSYIPKLSILFNNSDKSNRRYRSNMQSLEIRMKLAPNESDSINDENMQMIFKAAEYPISQNINLTSQDIPITTFTINVRFTQTEFLPL